MLSALQEVTPKADKVRLKIAAAQSGKYKVTLRQRERELATANLELKPGEIAALTAFLGAERQALR